jgi:hemophore-related protein
VEVLARVEHHHLSTTSSIKEPHMFFRSLMGAGVIVGAALVGTAATAAADPPNCTAADLAGVMAGVNAGTSSYLFTHPEVNAFFTSLKGKPRDQMRTEIAAYAEANPQVRDELRGVRQAATDFRDRCDAPVPDGPMG